MKAENGFAASQAAPWQTESVIPKALAKGMQVPDSDDDLGADCALGADQLVATNRDRNHGLVMTDCEHVFGYDCKTRWLYKHYSCPVCQRKLEE